MIDLLNIIISLTFLIAMACGGFAIVFTDQYGPYGLFFRITEVFNEHPSLPDTERIKTFKGNIYLILTCKYCLSFWLVFSTTTVLTISLLLSNALNIAISGQFIAYLMFGYIMVTMSSYGLIIMFYSAISRQGE